MSEPWHGRDPLAAELVEALGIDHRDAYRVVLELQAGSFAELTVWSRDRDEEGTLSMVDTATGAELVTVVRRWRRELGEPTIERSPDE